MAVHELAGTLVPTWRDRVRTNLTTLSVFTVSLLLYLLSLVLVPGFTTFSHLGDTLQLAGYLGIIAVGEGVVILGSGIDLSVSTTATAAGVLSASLVAVHLPSALIVVVVLGTGAGIGLFNGLSVAYIGVPPLVMTLATTSIVEGIILVLTNGSPRSGVPQVFASLSASRFADGLTGTVVVWVLLAAACAFFLSRTRVGRYLYSLGTNPVAARLSGVPVRAVTAGTYVVSGLTAAVAGCLLLGFTGVASTTMGDAYQLPAIAAVVIGGTNILGGRGTAFGVALGAFILTVIQNLLAVVNVAEAGREVLEGGVLLAVIVLYNLGNTRSRS